MKFSFVLHKVCLTGNIARGHKVKGGYPNHPAKTFYREGLRFALSCDNTLLSGDIERVPDPVLEVLHLVG